MPGKKLTAEAEQALADVQTARRQQRRARAEAEARAKALVEEETREAEDALAAAVARALAEGVSQSRVGREGMGTLDWPIVTRYAERGRALKGAA